MVIPLAHRQSHICHHSIWPSLGKACTTEHLLERIQQILLLKKIKTLHHIIIIKLLIWNGKNKVQKMFMGVLFFYEDYLSG